MKYWEMVDLGTRNSLLDCDLCECMSVGHIIAARGPDLKILEDYFKVKFIGRQSYENLTI